jgi:hypothetical protein
MGYLLKSFALDVIMKYSRDFELKLVSELLENSRRSDRELAKALSARYNGSMRKAVEEKKDSLGNP